MFVVYFLFFVVLLFSLLVIGSLLLVFVMLGLCWFKDYMLVFVV